MEDKDLKKQRAEQTPPPAFLRRVVESHDNPPKMEEVGEMEQVMTAFSQSDAWEYMQKFIKAKQGEIAQSVRLASDGSTNLEEVGFRFLAADQVNRFIVQLISFVEKYAAAKRAKDIRAEQKAAGGD